MADTQFPTGLTPDDEPQPRSERKRGGSIEKTLRIRRIVRIICQGGKRSDIIQFGEANWGLGERAVDKLIAEARREVRADWDIERPQMVADLLSQLSAIHIEARRTGQLHIALGAINAQARLAKLMS